MSFNPVREETLRQLLRSSNFPLLLVVRERVRGWAQSGARCKRRSCALHSSQLPTFFVFPFCQNIAWWIIFKEVGKIQQELARSRGVCGRARENSYISLLGGEGLERNAPHSFLSLVTLTTANMHSIPTINYPMIVQGPQYTSVLYKIDFFCIAAKKALSEVALT